MKRAGDPVVKEILRTTFGDMTFRQVDPPRKVLGLKRWQAVTTIVSAVVMIWWLAPTIRWFT